MIFLALDASTTAVGWALFDDDALLSSGVYVPPADLSWWNRVEAFRFWLCSQLDASAAVAVAYELATGAHGNTHTDRVLGALEYEARRVTELYTQKFITVTASQVQRRDYPNKNNLELARQIKGAPLDKKHPKDEADAIGIAYAAWGELKVAAWARQ